MTSGQKVSVTPISVVDGQEDVQEYGSFVCGVNYLSCYHRPGAAPSSAAVMKGRGVIVKLGAVLIISIVLAVFTHISVCSAQYKQSKCSQSQKFFVSVANQVFCCITCMIPGSAIFIPTS